MPNIRAAQSNKIKLSIQVCNRRWNLGWVWSSIDFGERCQEPPKRLKTRIVEDYIIGLEATQNMHPR